MDADSANVQLPERHPISIHLTCYYILGTSQLGRSRKPVDCVSENVPAKSSLMLARTVQSSIERMRILQSLTMMLQRPSQ